METSRALRAATEELRTQTRAEIHSLERMARRWERRGGVPRAEWEADAAEYLQSIEYLQAIEWADRENVVRWVIPLAGNEAVVGLDLDFEDARRAAAEEARSLHQPVASTPIALVQGEMGLLLFVPIVSANTFEGYIVGVHRIGRMLGLLLANTSKDFVIVVDAGAEPLWVRGRPEDLATPWTVADEVEIAGKTWRIQVSPTPERVASLRFGWPHITGIGGLAFAGLLSVAAMLWSRSRAQASEAIEGNRQLQAEIVARGQVEESLRRQKDEVEAIYMAHPDLIFSMDANWQVLEYHGSDEDLYVPASEFVGKDMRTILPPSAVEPLERAHADAVETGRTSITEYVLPIGEKLRHFEARMVVGGDGRILVLIRDIDERAQAEAVRRRFVEILQSTTDFVAIADTKAHLTFINRAGRELLGIGDDEELSSIRLTRMSKDWKVLVEEALPIALRDGAWSGESTLLGRNGESIPVNQVIIAHRSNSEGESNEVEFYSMIARDARPERAAERERLTLETRFQEAQRRESMGVLAGGIAHDFNNLLVSMLGNADLALADLPASAPGRTELEQIKKAALRAADLCNQMLAYSGGGLFQIRTFDLSELTRDMRSLLEVAIRPGIDVTMSSPEEPVNVRGDINQIRQIVMNLITNAAESFGDEPGQIEIRTSLLAATRENLERYELDLQLDPRLYAVLEVIDTGCGMDEETRRKIFDPFFSTKFTGRGLGLSSVIGIADRHEGAIHVKSVPGAGTTFTVLLPSALDAVERLDPESPSALEPSTQMHDLRILVVDDDPSVRNVACRMLALSNFRVDEASSGAGALEYLAGAADGSCIVLLDVTMPEMDGYATAREIRKRFPLTRMLLSSGYSDLAASRSASTMDELVDGFIQKPYTRAALVKELEAILVTAV
ncbi:MAG: response regulator [Deltaproteobacteria bacterium]|nr:response regulator [Deltaproteobacteria bacterium]